MSERYDELCRLMEPGIRLIYANDPRRMEHELRFMRLVAMDDEMLKRWDDKLMGRTPTSSAPPRRWWRRWIEALR